MKDIDRAFERLEEQIKEERIKKFKAAGEDFKRRQREKAALFAARYGSTSKSGLSEAYDKERRNSYAAALAEYYTKNFIPKYFVGVDPYEGDGGKDFTLTVSDGTTITSSLFKDGSVFPIKELNEQLNKLKQKKMKTKKFYHTFELDKRTITLCLLVTQQPTALGDEPYAEITTGYSVVHPEDTFDKELAKKISLGRAQSEKASLDGLAFTFELDLALDGAILKGLALRGERLIRRGEVVIKGIRDVE